MSNNTPKPASGGKLSTALIVSVIWCAAFGVFLWLHQEKPASPAVPPAPPETSVEKTALSSAKKPPRTNFPNQPAPHAHYAAELPPPPLTSGAADPVPEQPVIVPVHSHAVEPGPVLISSGDSYTGGGSIHGKISLMGNPPHELAIRLDETCGKMHPNGATTRRYVVAKNGGLANVLVYIAQGMEGMKFAVPPAIELNQIGCMYEPYISAAMVGQTVRIKNSDPVLHNVHALPRNDGNSEFNFGQPIQGMVDEKTFIKKITAPEVMVKIKCDVHDWMLAYVGVLDNPYFAVTDTNGNFTIPNLPPGVYSLVATHLKAGSATNAIQVTAGTDTPVNFTLKAK